jgi:hypothetical protein
MDLVDLQAVLHLRLGILLALPRLACYSSYPLLLAYSRGSSFISSSLGYLALLLAEGLNLSFILTLDYY